MTVDEQIAKAWGKLTGHKINPLPYWMDDTDAHRVPDPATQPWEWVRAFVASGRLCDFRLLFDMKDGTSKRYVCRIETIVHVWTSRPQETPEAALEAAIRAWKASR